MEQQSVENVYLDKVLAEQAAMQGALRSKKKSVGPMRQRSERKPQASPSGAEPTVRTADFRITGWWRWRTVVVSPNVYVVHTRRGRQEPLHIGLGQSFRFNPYTDAFLVVPAAMQTIFINANSICRERQGILVQAYVQWIVADIAQAYRKLDFSDPDDPMKVVNLQLQVQAEAAIKDKVATMGIDEVLTDKAPIIEELTHRLRAVAEGNREAGGSGGLGLEIVTVQIQEAVVSSARVWENLQKPFRAEQGKLARVAELDSEGQISASELAHRQNRETAEIRTATEIARLRAEAGTVQFDRDQSERQRRYRIEQEVERQVLAEKNATEKARRESELALVLTTLELDQERQEREIGQVDVEMRLASAQATLRRAAAEHEAALEELRHQAAAVRAARDLELEGARRDIDNRVSDGNLRAQLIERLPQIAEAMPSPKELRTVQIGQDGAASASLAGLVASVTSVVDGLRQPAAGDEATMTQPADA